MADGFMNENSAVGSPVPLAVSSSPPASAPVTGHDAQPSYHPTGWAPADRALATIDVWSGGRAGVVQRASSYLVIGGFAAVVNLALYTFLAGVEEVPFLIAQLIASEISILSNFIPNDRITFSHLPGHARSWWARCLRFHVTSIAGTIITIVVSWLTFQALYSHLFHLPAQAGLAHMFAQATAIWTALIFNFTFHHLFTYRQLPQSADGADAASGQTLAGPVSIHAWARVHPPVHE